MIIFSIFFPGEAFKYEVNDNIHSDENEDSRKASEERLAKSQKLQQLLGLSSDELQAVINDAKKFSAHSENHALTACRIVEIIAYLFLFGVFFLALNVWSKGDFGRIVSGIFPVEFESLGLNHYFSHYVPEEL